MSLEWASKLQRGSFRGAPFFIDSHEFSGGRKAVDHEFPQREQTRSEDLGRRIRQFNLNFFLLGDDYFAQRDVMLDALEKPGAGELIHPYLGAKQVVAKTFTLSESSNEGRIARFSVTFSEAGTALFPESLADGVGGVQSAIDSVKAASNSAFEDVFSVANQPAFVVQAAADNVEAVADFMTESVTKFTQPVSELTFSIQNLKGDALALVKTPGKLADRIEGVFDDLLSAFSDAEDTSEKIAGNFRDFTQTAVIGDSISRTRQRDNQNALINNAKEQAYAAQSFAAIGIDYTSSQQSLFIRNQLTQDINDQLFQVTDDDLYQDLRDLQASLIKALPPTDLSDLITFTPPKTLPALVIAYELFQDLDKEQEIIDQNEIEHPGFVPGGVPLEVAGG